MNNVSACLISETTQKVSNGFSTGVYTRNCLENVILTHIRQTSILHGTLIELRTFSQTAHHTNGS